MANRDHSLDDGIIQAAYSEFLAYGFQKASLHKIAEKAGVTTGAIYTRYKNKDALFASLLQVQRAAGRYPPRYKRRGTSIFSAPDRAP